MASQETDPFTVDGPYHADIEFVHMAVAPIENAPTVQGTFRVHGSIGIRDYRIQRDLPFGESRTYLLSPTQLFVREETEGCYGIPGTFSGTADQDMSVKEIVKRTDRQTSSVSGDAKTHIAVRLTKADAGASASASVRGAASSERIHSVEAIGTPARYGRVAAGWIVGRRYGDDLHDSYMDDRHWAEYKFMPSMRHAKLAFNVILPLECLNIQAEGSKTTPRIGFRKAQEADDRKHVRDRLKEAVAGMVARFQISALMENKGYRDAKDDLVLARVEITANLHDPLVANHSQREDAVSQPAKEQHKNRRAPKT